MLVKVAIYNAELSAPLAMLMRGAFHPDTLEFVYFDTTNFEEVINECWIANIKYVYLPTAMLVPSISCFIHETRYVFHRIGYLWEHDKDNLEKPKKFVHREPIRLVKGEG